MSLSSSQIYYPSMYFRVLFYLLLAHFIVSYGEPESVFELLKLPYYYLALSGSFVITLILAEYILAVSQYLDRKYLRFTAFSKRMLYQALWGIILSILLTIIMAEIYFFLRGTDIIKAGYFKYDFELVVCLILLLNTLCLINGMVQRFHYQFKTRIPSKERPKDTADFQQNVIAIYSVERGFVAILKNGESIIWTKTIEQSLQELPADKYFLINRSDIISKDMITGYLPSESRRLKLILNQPLASGRAFIVSQRKVVAFKRWFKG